MKYIILLLLLIPSQASADDAIKIALSSYVVANTLDLSTSLYLFNTNQYREGNPILRPFQDNPVLFTTVKMGLVSLVAYSNLKLYKNNPKLSVTLTYIESAIVTSIVINNARLMR